MADTPFAHHSAPSAVVLAANRCYAIHNSRLTLIKSLQEQGYRVIVAAAIDETGDLLRAAGCEVIDCPFERGGLALAGDYWAYRTLRKLYRRHRPVLVHHFNAKPVIAGTLAARHALGENVKIVNTITGLGHGFVGGGLTGGLAAFGYANALPRADRTIFQNRDDHRLFLKKGWINQGNSGVIVGSGIDIGRFGFIERKHRETLNVVMIGRLLGQKGVREFCEVAQILGPKLNARFTLVGEEEPGHADAVPAEWVGAQPGVAFAGRLEDVGPALRDADLFLFPSTYPEGVPRVVMEAAATGLPTVGFDVPGVREAVREGETGYLVPPGNVDGLREKTETLLRDRELRLRMGRAARALAEEAFDIEGVTRQYLEVYRSTKAA